MDGIHPIMIQIIKVKTIKKSFKNNNNINKDNTNKLLSKNKKILTKNKVKI
jgi:hypothetical protein